MLWLLARSALLVVQHPHVIDPHRCYTCIHAYKRASSTHKEEPEASKVVAQRALLLLVTAHCCPTHSPVRLVSPQTAVGRRYASTPPVLMRAAQQQHVRPWQQHASLLPAGTSSNMTPTHTAHSVQQCRTRCSLHAHMWSEGMQHVPPGHSNLMMLCHTVQTMSTILVPASHICVCILWPSQLYPPCHTPPCASPVLAAAGPSPQQ